MGNVKQIMTRTWHKPVRHKYQVQKHIMCWCLGRTLEVLEIFVENRTRNDEQQHVPDRNSLQDFLSYCVFGECPTNTHTRNRKQCPCPFSFYFATKLYSGLKTPCTIEQHMLLVTSRCCDHFAKTSPNDYFAKTSRDVWYWFCSRDYS